MLIMGIPFEDKINEASNNYAAGIWDIKPSDKVIMLPHTPVPMHVLPGRFKQLKTASSCDSDIYTTIMETQND